jgi:hypothetical protein
MTLQEFLEQFLAGQPQETTPFVGFPEGPDGGKDLRVVDKVVETLKVRRASFISTTFLYKEPRFDFVKNTSIMSLAKETEEAGGLLFYFDILDGREEYSVSRISPQVTVN